jgi:hypothetical protein
MSWFRRLLGLDVKIVPLYLCFPTWQVRRRYEKECHKAVRIANKVFKGSDIKFRIDCTLVQKYDNYNAETNHHDFDIYPGVVAIYLVNKIIWNGKDNWLGLATGQDRRLNMVSYPLFRKCIIVHELGHSMGLEHVERDDTHNIMRPFVPSGKTPRLHATKEQIEEMKKYIS